MQLCSPPLPSSKRCQPHVAGRQPSIERSQILRLEVGTRSSGTKANTKSSTERAGTVTLLPESSDSKFRPLRFEGDEAEELAILAELVAVLTKARDWGRPRPTSPARPEPLNLKGRWRRATTFRVASHCHQPSVGGQLEQIITALNQTMTVYGFRLPPNRDQSPPLPLPPLHILVQHTRRQGLVWNPFFQRTLLQANEVFR